MLTRLVDQRIQIAEDIFVTVVRIEGSKVKLGIEAPDHIKIKRDDAKSVGEIPHRSVSAPT